VSGVLSGIVGACAVIAEFVPLLAVGYGLGAWAVQNEKRKARVEGWIIAVWVLSMLLAGAIELGRFMATHNGMVP
jgi:hypothetical protein